MWDRLIMTRNSSFFEKSWRKIFYSHSPRAFRHQNSLRTIFFSTFETERNRRGSGPEKMVNDGAGYKLFSLSKDFSQWAVWEGALKSRIKILSINNQTSEIACARFSVNDSMS